MNKIIKLLILAAVTLLGLNACNQDNERAFYDESAPVAYSFLQPVLISEITADYNGKLQVTIARTQATEAASVGVKLTASTATAVINALFSVAGQATFAEGEFETKVDVQFTLDDLEFGEQYKFSIEFANAEENVSAGGIKKTDITASRKLIWEKFAEGVYSGALSAPSVLNLPASTWTVTMYKAQASTIYRLEDFYTKGAHFEFSWDGGQSITPYNYIGTVTLGGAPTLAVRTGGTYNYSGADRDVFLFVDPDPDYTFYDATDSYFCINYYAGMVIDGSVAGWGWKNDYYEITQQY
ncbi:MAG: hypothetical protein LBF69_04635 [Prevotellaceae bacterium]|jgi:hypothetical protein|nr:hypothetical protein [Prevotellaceae bacterium]